MLGQGFRDLAQQHVHVVADENHTEPLSEVRQSLKSTAGNKLVVTIAGY